MDSTRTLLCFAVLCCARSELVLCINRLWNGSLFLFFCFYFAKSSGYVWYVLCCAVPVGTGRLAGVMYDNMVLVERMSSEEL